VQCISLFGWLVAGAGLFREKSTAGWFGLREKYCWPVADKPSEQGLWNEQWRYMYTTSTVEQLECDLRYICTQRYLVFCRQPATGAR
jgi:hypothetical protein